MLYFPNEFVGEDNVPNVERRWLDDPKEVSGVFNFMLDGLYRLKENGGFSISKSAQETKVEFMRVSEPFKAWLNDCVVFVPKDFVIHQEAFDSYFDYASELGGEPDSKKMFYQKMKDTARVKSSRIRFNGKREWGFQGVSLKQEDEEQSKFGSVPFVPSVPNLGTQRMFESNKKGKEEEVADSRTVGTVRSAEEFDVDDYFIEGQFPTCFSCHGAISQVSELTNIDGKPIHKHCKAKIESQKTKEQ